MGHIADTIYVKGVISSALSAIKSCASRMHCSIMEALDMLYADDPYYEQILHQLEAEGLI